MDEIRLYKKIERNCRSSWWVRIAQGLQLVVELKKDVNAAGHIDYLLKVPIYKFRNNFK